MEKFTAVPFTQFEFSDKFWSRWQETVRSITIPEVYNQLKTTGRIDAIRMDWTPESPDPEPHIFWDSDVAKWIEAASYSLSTHPDPQLDALLDEVISLIASAQQPDGYLNVHYTLVEPDRRWKELARGHELYSAGHLIEAAVAHYQATGKTSLLDVIKRYADYIGSVFGREPGQVRGYCGHEEIELALVKLFRATGEPRYRDLASYFVDERGQSPNYLIEEERANGHDPYDSFMNGAQYMQAHKPVREQDRVTGHAVRAMYLYCAMADLAQTTDDDSLRVACERLWRHLCTQNMYLTGGIGSSRHNEGFTRDYDLPNETAYAETCAAIGLVFWAHRMLQMDANRRYADVMERALYNGVLSGISQSGDRFFYENPLASAGGHHRQEWFHCSCCPTNIIRLIASLGQYVYSTNETNLAVHLYARSSANVRIRGQAIEIHQETDYPWDGRIVLTVRTPQPVTFCIRLRIPGWCGDASLSVNGSACSIQTSDVAVKDGDVSLVDGYALIDREWRDGDTVELSLSMPVERTYANPRIRDDRGCVALTRGPLVYCLEAVDNGSDLNSLMLPDGPLTTTWRSDLLGGATTIEGAALRPCLDDWNNELYRSQKATCEEVQVVGIPYHAWDNREGGEMTVWLREA